MVRLRELEKRDNDEMKELAKFIEDENLRLEAPHSEVVGRETGTAEWKASRGEDGKQH
jgi:hypothetical protein